MEGCGALVAGTYTADAKVAPVEVDDPGPSCGESPFVVTCEDDRARLECPACETWHNECSCPAGTLDQYEPSELPAAFDRWMYSLFSRITAGFCANSAGHLSGRLDPDREHEPGEKDAAPGPELPMLITVRDQAQP